MSGDLLTTVVAAARRAADLREQRAGIAVAHQAEVRRPRGDAFRATLGAPGLRIIAECKRRSPSRGVLRRDYNPVAIARSYAAAGAAAVSVLTEPAFFDGNLDHLRAVRDAVDIPILRKDFVVTAFQIVEARAAGADAVLLIVAALTEAELTRLIGQARQLELAPLVEVHDAGELQRALDAGADLIGVNSRNLRTLEMSVAVFSELAPRLPSHITAVAESGLKSADDLRRLHDLRYDAFLIGERFMTDPDPGAALAALLAAGEAVRSRP
jgi:indole-3-glycerol phosphate synthase